MNAKYQFAFFLSLFRCDCIITYFTIVIYNLLNYMNAKYQYAFFLSLFRCDCIITYCNIVIYKLLNYMNAKYQYAFFLSLFRCDCIITYLYVVINILLHYMNDKYQYILMWCLMRDSLEQPHLTLKTALSCSIFKRKVLLLLILLLPNTLASILYTGMRCLWLICGAGWVLADRVWAHVAL